MQEENKTVDIDTSGPSVDVELQNDSKENETPEVETSAEETSTEVEAKEEKKEEPKKADEQKDNELENYSKDVQRRIAKLTGKWREAERQKEEAIAYAEAQIKAKKEAEI